MIHLIQLYENKVYSRINHYSAILPQSTQIQCIYSTMNQENRLAFTISEFIDYLNAIGIDCNLTLNFDLNLFLNDGNSVNLTKFSHNKESFTSQSHTKTYKSLALINSINEKCKLSIKTCTNCQKHNNIKISCVKSSQIIILIRYLINVLY